MIKSIQELPQLFAEFLASKGISQDNLPEAKGGMTRNVFDLGDSVAKVAKNAKGIQQNEEELDDIPQTPKALAKGKDFVITEKVERDDHKLNEFLKPLREFDSDDFEKKNPKLMKLMDEMGLGEFKKKKLLWGDFTAKRNWGINKEGKPVLLDKGTLNSDIYAHEDAPKKVQSQYAKISKERRQKGLVLAARGINRRKEVMSNAK